jgi:hypothetical protein
LNGHDPVSNVNGLRRVQLKDDVLPYGLRCVDLDEKGTLEGEICAATEDAAKRLADCRAVLINRAFRLTDLVYTRDQPWAVSLGKAWSLGLILRAGSQPEDHKKKREGHCSVPRP